LLPKGGGIRDGPMESSFPPAGKRDKAGSLERERKKTALPSFSRRKGEKAATLLTCGKETYKTTVGRERGATPPSLSAHSSLLRGREKSDRGLLP